MVRKDKDSQKEQEWSAWLRVVSGTMTLVKDKETWDGQQCLVWMRMVGVKRILGKKDSGEG